MMQQVRNFTTLLSEITPEAQEKIRSLPEWDSSLPPYSYLAAELRSANVSFHRSVTYGSNAVPLHSHSFFEYVFCRQAPEMEYLVGTHRYRIRSGDLIYIPPGIPHRPILPDNPSAPFVRDELWLRAEFITFFGRRLPSDFLEKRRPQYLLRLDSTLQTEIGSLYLKGIEEAENQVFRWDNAVEGYATLLLVATSRAVLNENAKLLKREEGTLFDRIVAYLEDNLGEKITLESVADRFYVSKSTVNRTFQKHMGTSFYRCLSQRRLLAAQQLIWEGTPLEKVSVKVGFSDYATFYRAFRQAFGISPRQYQKLQAIPDSGERPSGTA